MIDIHGTASGDALPTEEDLPSDVVTGHVRAQLDAVMGTDAERVEIVPSPDPALKRWTVCLGGPADLASRARDVFDTAPDGVLNIELT